MCTRPSKILRIGIVSCLLPVRASILVAAPSRLHVAEALQRACNDEALLFKYSMYPASNRSCDWKARNGLLDDDAVEYRMEAAWGLTYVEGKVVSKSF